MVFKVYVVSIPLSSLLDSDDFILQMNLERRKLPR